MHHRHVEAGQPHVADDDELRLQFLRVNGVSGDHHLHHTRVVLVRVPLGARGDDPGVDLRGDLAAHAAAHGLVLRRPVAGFVSALPPLWPTLTTQGIGMTIPSIPRPVDDHEPQEAAKAGVVRVGLG